MEQHSVCLVKMKDTAVNHFEWLQKSKSSLTPCILMDFPIQINGIGMGLSIIYFMGSQVEMSAIIAVT